MRVLLGGEVDEDVGLSCVYADDTYTVVIFTVAVGLEGFGVEGEATFGYA